MTKTYHLYVLRDPRTQEIRYVGQTTQNPPRLRLLNHMACARKRTTPPIYAWIRGIVKDGFEPLQEILWKTENLADIDAIEISTIRGMRKKGYKLLNRCHGGSARRYEHSEEQKQRGSERLIDWVKKNGNARTGIPHRESTKELMRVAAQKRWENQEYRDKLKKSRAGLSPILSKDERERRSTVQKERWLDPDYREKMTLKDKGVERSTEFKEKVSKGLKAALAALSPEEKERRRMLIVNRWKDPEYKAKNSKAISLARRKQNEGDPRG